MEISHHMNIDTHTPMHRLQHRFLLIIFLQLLRSTTTSPSPLATSPSPSATSPHDNRLQDVKGLPPLITFQHHPHPRRSGVSSPLEAADLTPPPARDYFAYNVAAARDNDDSDDDNDDDNDDDDDTLLMHARGGKKANQPLTTKGLRTLFQVGDSESELPECGAWAVCNRVDVYEPGRPWVEKQCRCPSTRRPCSALLSSSDGHTVTDKTRHYKVCEPVRRLPKCGYFRDVTWTLRSTAENGTQQTMHCLCPRNSVAYLIKRQAYQTSTGVVGYQYSFACSPHSRLRCQRKEPCRLFTVRKRQELLDEVNTNTLCQCPHAHSCPHHHTHPGVIQGKSYVEENVRTYSGYCLANTDGAH